MGRLRWKTTKLEECRGNWTGKGHAAASVCVFIGGGRNITRQAGFMRNFIYHLEGDKSTDIGKANWALMRAKTRYLKGFNLNQKD